MSAAPNNEWTTPAPVPAPSPPGRDYEPIHPGSGRETLRERLKRFFGPIAAGALLLLTKLKAVLLLLPKLKLLTTSGTMLVSIAAYALIWGWSFAIGFVVLLVRARDRPRDPAAPRGHQGLGADVHPVPGRRRDREVDGRRRRGRGARRPRRPRARDDRHAGAVRASGSRPASEFWQALAYVGFFINLFNLLPVLPLDGGRAMAALSPVDVAGRLRAADRAHDHVLQPDPPADPGVRRLRALPPLEGPQHARVTRLPRRPHPHAGDRRARSTSASWSRSRSAST